MARGEVTSDLILSASAISSFLSCQQKHHYRYNERLERIRVAPQLERGIAIHKAVQAWWNGRDMQPAMEAWRQRMVDQLLPWEFDEWTNDYRHVTALLERYREHYTTPEGMVVVGTELEVAGSVAPGLRMVGFVDLVVTMDGELWAVEIKTARDLSRRMAYLHFDQQPVVYSMLLRELGMPVEGLLFDGIRTYPYKDLSKVEPEKLFRREKIRPTPAQERELRRNVMRVADQIHDAQEKGFSRNLGASCIGCDFKDVCHAELAGDTMLSDAMRRTRYKIRRRRNEEAVNG